MPHDVTVIGDGAWGTALALVLAGNRHRVRLWSPFPVYAEQMRRNRENTDFLPGMKLPRELVITADRNEAVDGSTVLVLAVPTRYFRTVLQSFGGLLTPGYRVISVAKGLDPETHSRMTEVTAETLHLPHAAALSGPSFALEVARGIPTAVTVACASEDTCLFFQNLFSTPRFRVYTCNDVKGVELGGALKNVMAVAVGVSDGLGFGDNTRAALITRGLAEITRLGCALGAKQETFAGLSGLGDLVVTCTGHMSRNRAFGERIGRGERPADILAATKQAIEGAWNCASARILAERAGVEVPITDQVHALVNEGRKPLEAVEALLNRDVRPEFD